MVDNPFSAFIFNGHFQIYMRKNPDVAPTTLCEAVFRELDLFICYFEPANKQAYKKNLHIVKEARCVEVLLLQQKKRVVFVNKQYISHCCALPVGLALNQRVRTEEYQRYECW